MPDMPLWPQNPRAAFPEDPGAPTEDVPEYPENSTTISTTTRRATRTRRRASDDPYTVELAVFLDQKLYAYIKKRYPRHNQDERALQIVMTLVNAVSITIIGI